MTFSKSGTKNLKIFAMKINRKKFLCLPSLLLIGISIYVFYNKPLRTAIYRNFYKQSTYIISEKDTIYTFGYYGVRKYLLNEHNNSLSLLAENDSFCHNCFIGHLIGRSGVVHGNYLYVAARSYLGGRYVSKDKGYLKGMLLILRKSDLQIIKEIPVDYSMIEAKIYRKILAVSGLQGFNIYDISKPLSPQLDFSFRTTKAWEFQGVEFIPQKDSLYVAFARWSEGLSIYNITNPNRTYHRLSINIQHLFNVENNSLQSFRLKYSAPYLYATIAPVPKELNTKNDYRGVLVYDLTDINNIKYRPLLIPRKAYYKAKIGDPQPSHIDIYKDFIYTNFGEKGICKFHIKNSIGSYKGIIKIESNKILPFHITDSGFLITGDYDDDKIVSFNLNK